MDRGVYRVTERTEAGGALGAGGRPAFTSDGAALQPALCNELRVPGRERDEERPDSHAAGREPKPDGTQDFDGQPHVAPASPRAVADVIRPPWPATYRGPSRLTTTFPYIHDWIYRS